MKRLRRWKPKNPGTKLVALGLTLVVSGAVYLDQDHVSTIHVPIEVNDVPPGRVVLDDVPAEATIEIVAAGRELVRMWFTGRNPEELVLIARVADDADQFDRSLSADDVAVPLDTNVRVTRVVEPTRLTFRLDELAERELPVTPRVMGALPRGFVRSGDVSAVPPVVRVSGPVSLVDPLREVHTRAVSLEDRRGPFNATAEILLPDKLVAVPAEVVVHADVEAERQDQLQDVRVVVRNARGLVASVQPPAGDVTLLGPASRIDRLRQLAAAGEPTGLVIAVDASGKGPGTYEVTPVVELVDDLRLVSVDPPRFQLLLEEGPAPAEDRAG